MALASKINEIASSNTELDGFVVTHGTATLEETAYFLNLTVKTDKPVVIIGAQRPSSGFATTGSNLLSAVRVASSKEAHGYGVLVVLTKKYKQREVTKTSTLRLETFQTPDIGMLGYADPDGKVALYRKPTRLHTSNTIFNIENIKELPVVDIVLSYAGANGTAIDAFIESGTEALIIASLAPGLPTPDQVWKLLLQ